MTVVPLAIGDHIAYTMTYMSAGVGGLIDSRSKLDPVRNGTIVHNGKLAYFQSVAKAVKANTPRWPWWCFDRIRFGVRS